MIAKALFFVAVIAVVVADNYGKAYSEQKVFKYDGHQEIVKKQDGYGHEYVDYYAYPKYEFEYKVDDPHTGDIKEQEEKRDGDKVEGFYALRQPDGSVRKVVYKSDDHKGFQADVKFETRHIREHYGH